jgi:hypothetical protein
MPLPPQHANPTAEANLGKVMPERMPCSCKSLPRSRGPVLRQRQLGACCELPGRLEKGHEGRWRSEVKSHRDDPLKQAPLSRTQSHRAHVRQSQDQSRHRYPVRLTRRMRPSHVFIGFSVLLAQSCPTRVRTRLPFFKNLAHTQ